MTKQKLFSVSLWFQSTTQTYHEVSSP